MPIRPKTIRRLAILAAVAATLGGVAELVIHHRHNRREAWLTALRDQGLVDYRSGDYSAAAEELDRYITLHDSDDAVVLAFAISKTRSGTTRTQDLQSAQQRLQEILAHKPDNLAAQHALIELSRASGDLETMERVSDAIIQHDPADPAALEARVTTRLRQARFEDALVAAGQRAAARPDDLDARLAAMQLMMRLHKPAAAVTAYATAFQAGSGSAATRLLQSIAIDYTGRRDAAIAELRQAAKQPITDVAVAGQIVNLFDAYKCFNEADAYLEAAVQNNAAPELRRALAMRLWQQDRFDRIPQLLKPRENDDATVIALNAAALFETKHSVEAVAALAKLYTHTDRLAAAWTTAVDARYVTTATPADQISRLGKALSRDPENGIIRAWLGDCFANAGEISLAIRHWRLTNSAMPNWPDPAIALSRALLDHHRSALAVQIAAALYDHRPSDRTALNLAIVRFEAQDDLEHEPAGEIDLMQFVSGLHDDPLLLPVRIGLLARTGHRDQAQVAANQAIQSTRPLDPAVALKLLIVIRQQGLAGEDQLLGGVTLDDVSPALLQERTAWLARSGRADQAMSEWAAAVAAHPGAAHPGAAQVDWRLGQCRYLDSVASMRAAGAWQNLAKDYPDLPAVQMAICSATSIQMDPQFVAGAADRLHDITGDSSLQWRLARARLLTDAMDSTAGATSVEDGVEAVTLLTDVVREAPFWIEPRIELARALTKTGSPTTAIEHLRSAASISPSSVDVELELIRLLRSQGHIEEVAAALHGFIPPAEIDNEQRVALAAAMADAGMNGAAIALLTDTRRPLPPPGTLLLAEQYKVSGRVELAQATYDTILAAPNPSPAALASAADFQATRGQGDAARQVLQRLADSDALPQDIAIATGRYEERFGNESAALEQFKRAANTQSEAGAVALIDFHLRHGRGVEAALAAKQALARMPGSRVLADRLIEAQAATSRAYQPGDLKPLIDVLSHDPSRAAEVAALRALGQIGEAKVSSLVLARTLRQASADFPGDLPLAQQTVRLCIRRHDADGAVAVAQRTLAANPNDPAALRLLVDALRAGKQWEAMQSTAARWQARLSAPTIDTAAAIAEAQLGQKQIDAALATLQPFREAIVADARSQPQAASVMARVLLSAGKAGQAIALVGELFPDAAGRRSARSIARDAALTLDDALSVYNAVKTATPATALDEQIDLADLLADIGRKFSDTTTLSNAANAYGAYLRSTPGDTSTLLSLAGVEQQLGEFAPAETHLRAVLSAAPSNADAKNDLACVLMAQDKLLSEAEHLARAAIATAPNAANYYDTLARILTATGRQSDARLAFQNALRLDPNLVPARVSLAKLMRDQGDTTAARNELRRVDGTLQVDPHAGDYVADELTTLRAEMTRLDP